MPLNYVENEFLIEHKTSPCRPYGQSPMGYGRKIATGHMIRLDHRGPWRRVYATCFSNSASHWVIVNGKQYHWNGN